MSRNPPGGANPFDPYAPWRGAFDAYLESWSKAMIDLVNSEAYAQATGAMLDAYLSASAPLRQSLERTMTAVLQQLQLPTRAEVTGMAERLTNIEMRLDDLDAKLDTIAADLKTPAGGATQARGKTSGKAAGKSPAGSKTPGSESA